MSGGRAPGGAQTLLLLWEPGDTARADDEGSAAAEYGAWARRVAETGVAITGEELAVSRRIVGAGSIPPDGRVGGFFLVGTADLAEAQRLAQGHPHVARGGWIEVAPVVRR